MNISSATRFRVLIEVILIVAPLTAHAAVAVGPSLSKITAAQISKLMQLPQNYAAFDAVAECAKPVSVRCAEMDKQMIHAQTVFTVAEDGTTQPHECEQGRQFRFDGMARLWLFIRLCRDGPLAMPALLETKAVSGRFAKRLFDDIAQRNDGRNPFSGFAVQRAVNLGAEETAHIFSIVLVGHGIGFVPTAVVAGSQRNDTLVLQFLIVPEDRDMKDVNHPVAKLVSKPTDMMEALAKELIRWTR